MRRSLLNRPAPAAISLVVLLLALVATLFSAPLASAQGANGSVPDPISARDLDRYADRLDLSAEQRQAVERLHQQYRAAFAELREKEIAEYIEATGGGGFRIAFDQEQIKADTKALRKVLSRIASLDRRFFTNVESLLTEDQLATLPRVRKSRQRARSHVGPSMLAGMLNAGSRIDLSVMVGDLTLSPDLRSTIDPMLERYEQRLTVETEKLHERSVNMGLIMLQKLEERGASPVDATDPEQSGAFFDHMFAAMNDAQAEISKHSSEIARINRQTLRALADQLPADQVTVLRERVIERAYDEALGEDRILVDRFKLALDESDLTDEQRTQITSLQTAFLDDRWSLVEQFMDAVDDDSRRGLVINPTPEQQAEQEQHDKRMEQLRERRTALVNRHSEALNQVLDADLVSRIDRHIARKKAEEEAAPQQEVQQFAVIAIAQGESGDGAGFSEIRTFSGTTSLIELSESPSDHEELAGLPTPISTRDTVRYASRLQLSDPERDILSALHDEYRDGFDIVEQQQYAVARDAQAVQWTPDPDTGEMTPPTISEVSRLHAAKRAAVSAVLDLDRQLFDDIQTLVDEARIPQADRLRLARQRSIYTSKRAPGGGMFSFGGGGANITIGSMGGSAESSVDVAALIDNLDLSDDQLGTIDETLLTYEHEATDVFRRHYEASRRIEEDQAKMIARFTRASEDGNRREISLEGENAEAMEDLHRQARESKSRLLDLNRTVLNSLTGALDAATAESLRRAYNRRAFPDVYHDPRSILPRLRLALSLDDLTPDQRQRLQELTAGYNAAYDAFCEQLVAHARESSDTELAEPGAFDFHGIQNRSHDTRQIRFDRNELTDRTRSNLRAILNPDQIQQIGGLNEPRHN